jgi:hypothetical protein
LLVALQLEDIWSELGCAVTGSPVGQALQLLDSQRVDAAVPQRGRRARLPVADPLAILGLPYIFATGYGGSALTELYRGCALLEKPFLRNQPPNHAGIALRSSDDSPAHPW